MNMTLGVLVVAVCVGMISAECEVITDRLDRIEDAQEIMNITLNKTLMNKHEELLLQLKQEMAVEKQLQLQLKTNMSELEQKLSKRSAFSTTMIGNNHQYGAFVKILFPVVRYNLGQHYDAGTSEYTCPYDGVYLFQLSITNAAESKIAAHIFKAGENVSGVYENGTLHTGAVTTVTECTAGEKVLVKSGDSEVDVLGDGWPVFSGVYLYPSY